jgi:hypothetical protein
MATMGQGSKDLTESSSTMSGHTEPVAASESSVDVANPVNNNISSSLIMENRGIDHEYEYLLQNIAQLISWK